MFRPARPYFTGPSAHGFIGFLWPLRGDETVDVPEATVEGGRDSPEVLWDIEPHTAAKHRILAEYWNAWLPILGSSHEGVNYLDAFAGPGEYRGHEPGSPIIVLEGARDHKFASAVRGVTFAFIEKRKDRRDHLDDLIKARLSSKPLPPTWKWFTRQGEFATEFDREVAKLRAEGRALAPTLAFIDPFGTAGFPLASVRSILGFRSCEVMVTFMVGFAKRFLTELNLPMLDGLFGTREWEGAKDLHDPERTDYLIGLYARQLRSVCRAKWVLSFEMRPTAGAVLYHLFFATNNREGFHKIKEAMLKVGSKGDYCFVDTTDPNQRTMLEFFGDGAPAWVSGAADDTWSRFRGRANVPAGEVKEWLNYESTRYVYKEAVFARLINDGRMERTHRARKARGYSDDDQLTFTA